MKTNKEGEGMTAASNDKYDPSRFNISLRGVPLNPADENNMVDTVLRAINIECCGCGEEGHNKLRPVTVAIPHKNITLKPKIFICGDCIKKLEFNKPQ